MPTLFTIYTSGNFELMDSIFLYLQHAFQDGGPFDVKGFGPSVFVILMFFAGAVKGLMEKGTPDFVSPFKGLLFYLIMVANTTSVNLESRVTGQAATFDDIPVAFVIGGAVASNIPDAILAGISSISRYPSEVTNGDGGYVDAYRSMIKQDAVIATSPLISGLGAPTTNDLNKSLDNYIKDCVEKDMALQVNQDVFLADLRSSTDPWSRMMVNSPSWYTQLKLNTPTFNLYSCRDAYTKLSHQFNNTSSAFKAELDAVLELNNINISNINRTMNTIGSGSLDAFQLQVNSFIDYRLGLVAKGLTTNSPLSQYYDGIEFQAREKRILSMTGDANLWMEMGPVITTVIEALIWFLAPIMSLVMLSGSGHMILFKYFKFIVVVGCFPIVGAFISMYMDWSISNLFQPSAMGNEIWSNGYINNFYTSAASYVAIGSYLTAAIPMISYALVSGSDYMISSLAAKMGSTAHVDTSAVAPSIATASTGGVYKFGNSEQRVTESGNTASITSSIKDINGPVLSAVSATQSALGTSLQNTTSQMKVSESSASKQAQQIYSNVLQGSTSQSSNSSFIAGLSSNEQSLINTVNAVSDATGVDKGTVLNGMFRYMASATAEGGAATPGTKGIPPVPMLRDIAKLAVKAGIGVNGSAGKTISEGDYKKVQNALTTQGTRGSGKGATLQDSKGSSWMAGLNTNNGFTRNGQDAISHIRKYSESSARAEALQTAVNTTNGISSPVSTDFTRANGNEAWADKVISGTHLGGSPLTDQQISNRSQKVDEYNAQYHNNGNRGLAAARLFMDDFKTLEGDLAASTTVGETAQHFGKMSNMLQVAGKDLGDQNLDRMSQNMSKVATSLGQTESRHTKVDRGGAPTEGQVNSGYTDAKVSANTGIQNAKVGSNKYDRATVESQHNDNKTDVNNGHDTNYKSAVVNNGQSDSVDSVKKAGARVESDVGSVKPILDTVNEHSSNVAGMFEQTPQEKVIAASKLPSTMSQVLAMSTPEQIKSIVGGVSPTATPNDRAAAVATYSATYGEGGVKERLSELNSNPIPENKAERDYLNHQLTNANNVFGSIANSNPEKLNQIKAVANALDTGLITEKEANTYLKASSNSSAIKPLEYSSAAETAKKLENEYGTGSTFISSDILASRNDSDVVAGKNTYLKQPDSHVPLNQEALESRNGIANAALSYSPTVGQQRLHEQFKNGSSSFDGMVNEIVTNTVNDPSSHGHDFDNLRSYLTDMKQSIPSSNTVAHDYIDSNLSKLDDANSQMVYGNTANNPQATSIQQFPPGEAMKIHTTPPQSTITLEDYVGNESEYKVLSRDENATYLQNRESGKYYSLSQDKGNFTGLFFGYQDLDEVKATDIPNAGRGQPEVSDNVSPNSAVTPTLSGSGTENDHKSPLPAYTTGNNLSNNLDLTKQSIIEGKSLTSSSPRQPQSESNSAGGSTNIAKTDANNQTAVTVAPVAPVQTANVNSNHVPDVAPTQTANVNSNHASDVAPVQTANVDSNHAPDVAPVQTANVDSNHAPDVEPTQTANVDGNHVPDVAPTQTTTYARTDQPRQNYEEAINPSFIGDGTQSPMDADQGYASSMVDGKGSPMDPDSDVSVS
ncbi:hypothetical protein AYY20_16780 [Photobacterium aquimaris]|uniref:conjugal transfer protein TraG N-terminal domain-containing protein n=1 Tax=Photobacterium aquimaris TaxID=512643 RepID=UPI0007EFF9BB|nr:hypothetical protein AYY20_16780 [Photobacterium aquimaris]